MVQFGQTDMTLRAIDAIQRSRYGGEIHIAVYDNASPNGPGPVANLGGVHFTQGLDNLGFGPAHNLLVEKSDTELLIVANNDIVVGPLTIHRMVERLLQSPNIAAVTPQYRTFDGSILEMGAIVGRDGSGWQLSRNENASRSIRSIAHQVDYGSAAFLLMRRQDFVGVGGFSDLYAPAYYEDTDLCFQLTEDNRRVVVEPKAVVYHLEGGTAGTDLSQGYKAFQVRNHGRFSSRWKSRLKDHEPLSPEVAFNRTLDHPRTPNESSRRILWIHPHLPRPDCEGGDARIIKEIKLLVAQGHLLTIWAEHIGDHRKYGPLFEDLGVRWFGYQEPSRWPLNSRANEKTRTLQDLLKTEWDGIVIWSAEVAERFTPIIRQLKPGIPIIIDNGVLLYLQSERGDALNIKTPKSIQRAKQWELDIYRQADGVIASSEVEADILRAELPHLQVTSFDVGTYPPTLCNGSQRDGDLVFLGNFLHPPNIDAIEWWVEKIAPAVARIHHKPIPLRVFGSASDTALADLVKPGILEVVGWVEDLKDEFDRARAFLVPLRYGAGTKDKISIALSYGVPTITTTVGAESMPAELYSALRIADAPEAIAKEVVNLMTDTPQWETEARRARSAAERGWKNQAQRNRHLDGWIRDLTS